MGIAGSKLREQGDRSLGLCAVNFSKPDELLHDFCKHPRALLGIELRIQLNLSFGPVHRFDAPAAEWIRTCHSYVTCESQERTHC